MDKEVGVITHWFGKIGVAVIKLSGSLSVGDKIKIKKGESEVEDTVASIQIDHKDVSSAGKGDDAAIKLSGEAKEGAKVYK